MKTYSSVPNNSERVLPIVCPICGSKIEKQKSLYNLDSFIFRKCTVCSLVLQNPQPIFSDLQNRYDENYFKYEIENEESFFSLMMMALTDISFKNLPLIARSDGKIEGSRRILDIGCATGRFLYEFKQRGWETAGVEICSNAAEYGNKQRNVNIKNCTLEKAAFTDKYFSVIHASHLIEHLNDPLSFLSEVYRILSDEGYFIVVTPNIKSFQGILTGYRWRSAIADHLFLYSVDTLKNICNKAGFTMITRKTWGGLPKGSAPPWLKRIFDSFAKKTGLGDVMVTLFCKSN